MQGHFVNYKMVKIFSLVLVGDPQIIGLGMTFTLRECAIKDLDEASGYCNNDTLRIRLLELCDALFLLEPNDVEYVMAIRTI